MPDTGPDLKRGWAVLERVALKALATGNFGWFVLLIVSGAIVWKLDSPDLKEVLLIVFKTFGWLGYIVAGVTVFVAVKTLRWRERFYESEMKRIAEVRNELMQTKLELPLQSSSTRKTGQ